MDQSQALNINGTPNRNSVSALSCLTSRAVQQTIARRCASFALLSENGNLFDLKSISVCQDGRPSEEIPSE